MKCTKTSFCVKETFCLRNVKNFKKLPTLVSREKIMSESVIPGEPKKCPALENIVFAEHDSNDIGNWLV